MPAGEPDEAGDYPPDSLNGRIVARLKRLADTQRDYNRPSPSESADDAAPDAEAESAVTTEEDKVVAVRDDGTEEEE